MSNKYKWLIAGVLVLGIVVIAQASALNSYYFPMVYNEPTITPTPTATPKPTVCLNNLLPKVCFTDIDYKPTTSKFDEWVTVKNNGNSSVELENWRIASDSSIKFKYDFPKFTLNAGQTVKVWTKIGTNSTSNLYMNRTEQFWQDNSDCGYLKDDERKTINSFCYGITGFFAAPVNK